MNTKLTVRRGGVLLLLSMVTACWLAAGATAQDREDRGGQRQGRDRSEDRRQRDDGSDDRRDRSSRDDGGGNSGSDSGGGGASFDERYAVLAQMNIFVRNSTRFVPTQARDDEDEQPQRDEAPAEPDRPEKAFVLTGIALKEGRHVAFVENRTTGATERVTPGEPVAGGTIVSVELDFLVYEAGGERTQVEVGRDFTGAVPPAAPLASTTASARPGPAPSGGGGPGPGPASAAEGTPPQSAAQGGEAVPPEEANLSMAERMKLRRQRERGGAK